MRRRRQPGGEAIRVSMVESLLDLVEQHWQRIRGRHNKEIVNDSGR
jgi:hypothetical protein